MTEEKRQNNGTKVVSSTNGAGITEHPYVKKKKNESRQSPYTLHFKVNQKWIIGLDIKYKNYKARR